MLQKHSLQYTSIGIGIGIVNNVVTALICVNSASKSFSILSLPQTNTNYEMPLPATAIPTRYFTFVCLCYALIALCTA